MKILVTGAKGQVGQVILPGLAGHEVIATDKDTLDVTDSVAVRDAVADCDVVIHLVMQRGASVSWEEAEWDTARGALDVTVFGAYNVLRAACELGKRAICASSCLTTVASSDQYVTEATRSAGGGLYGIIKASVEHLCRELRDDYGTPITLVRIGGFEGNPAYYNEPPNCPADAFRETSRGWAIHKEDLMASFVAIAETPVPWSFLHVVADQLGRRWDLESLWLNHRFRPRQTVNSRGFWRYDDRGNLDDAGNTLVDAAIRGNDPNLQPALRASDPNVGNGLPLRWACSLGQWDAAHKLLCAGADPNSFGGDPLRQAAASGEMATFDLLLSCGADPAVDGGEAIAWAAGRKRMDVVTRMLADGMADTNQLGAALYHAVSRQDIGIVELLLSWGADPNFGAGEILRRSIHGSGHRSGGDISIAKALLAAGCVQIKRPDHPVDNAWPLCEAIQGRGNPRMVELLLQYGADPDNMLMDDGSDAYVEAAVARGYSEALALIGRDATGKRVTT